MAKKRSLPEGIYNRKGSPYLWIKVRQFDEEQGKKVDIYKSSETTDVEAAKLVRDELRVKAGHGTLIQELKVVKQGTRLKELIECELRRASREVSPKWYNTMKARCYGSKKTGNFGLLPYFGENMRVKDLTTDRLVNFVEHCQEEEGFEPATINCYLSLLHGAYQTGYDWSPPKVDRIPKFPLFPKSKLRVRSGYLEWEDYQALVEEIDPSLKTLTVILYHLGLRKGEALELRWDKNIRFNPPGSEIPGYIVLNPLETKNNEARICPMYGDLGPYLRHQYEIRQQCFPKCQYVNFWLEAGMNGARFGVGCVPGELIKDFRDEWTRAVTAVAETVGKPDIADLLVHDMRRSAVTNLLTYANMTEKEAMLISGHKTDSMIKRYQIVRAVVMDDLYTKMQNMYLRKTAPPELPSTPPPNLLRFEDLMQRRIERKAAS